MRAGQQPNYDICKSHINFYGEQPGTTVILDKVTKEPHFILAVTPLSDMDPAGVVVFSRAAARVPRKTCAHIVYTLG